MTDELQHHGVKGQKWGVRRPDGPDGTVTGIAGKGTPTKGGDKKGTAKPNPSAFKKSPQRVAAEHREQIMREIETLRSAGREDLAKKLEATLNGIPKGAEEGEDTEAQTEGEGEGKEGEEEEEDKKKGKGGGKAAAAPKAAKPKEDKAALAAEKAAKEKAAQEKAERSKWQSLAKSQREVADSFREGATTAKQELAKLSNSAADIARRLPGYRDDLATAVENGDKGAIKTIRDMITRLEGEQKGLEAAIAVQTSQAEKLSAKAKEWDELSDKSLENIKAIGDQKKRDAVRHGEVLVHYGIKGQKWGVRRTAAQLGRVRKKNSRQAQRDASKEAKTLSDSELKARINRLQMEKQYSDLVKQQVERDRTAMEEGAAAVGNILLQSGKEALKNTTSASMTYAMKKGVSKAGVPLKNKKK